MLFIEEVSRMSKCGCSDIELLEYINEHFDEIECELNGDEYKEPKKHKHNFCIDCNLEMLIDYERSIWFAPNVEYLNTLSFMCNHTIIRCDIREGNASTRDMTILRSY